MRRSTATLLLFSTLAFAEPRVPAETSARVTVGLGAANGVTTGNERNQLDMLGGCIRVLMGPEDSPWRWGGVWEEFIAFTLFDSPTPEATSLHAVVASELAPPSEAFTIVLLGGLGGTRSVWDAGR